MPAQRGNGEVDGLEIEVEARRAKTGNAVTAGFGPRFQHSTGQFHKGGPDNALFIVITTEPAADFEVPTEGLTFGTLNRAQALGDYEALIEAGRKVLRIHLTSLSDMDAIPGYDPLSEQFLNNEQPGGMSSRLLI